MHCSPQKQNGTTATGYRQLAALLCLGLLLLTAGCGYHHPSTVPTNGAPMKLALSNWKNQTAEFALQSDLLQELSRWCSKASFISMTDPPVADYVLTGTIVSLRSPGHTYTETDQVVELRATLTVSYTLSDGQGKVIFREPATVMTEDYPLASDAIRTRDNRRKALERILRDLSEEIYMRLLIVYEREGKE